MPPLVEVLGELLDARTAPSSIPLARGVDLEAIKAGDSDPMEVTVRIAPGKGSHGFYTEAALKKLVSHVQEHTLAGYRGHIKGDELGHRFDYPSSHWIGAEWRADGAAYIRGVVDQSQPDLKRLIRAGRITQPSILYSDAKTERVGGEVRITDLNPLSIDWAPLGRAGMATAEVVGHEMAGSNDPPKGDTVPTIRELLASLREQRATPQEVLGELGFSGADVLPHLNVTLADVGPILDKDGWKRLADDQAELALIREKLNKPAGEVASAVVEVLGELGTLRDRDRSASLERAVDRSQQVPDFARQLVLVELQKVAGEMHGALVDGELDTAVGKVLELPHIKPIIGARAAAPMSTPIHTVQSNRPPATTTTGGAPAGLRQRERAI